MRRYFTVPVHTKARYHLFGIFVAAFSITLTVILGGYEVYKKVFALNESSFSMPQQVAFNRGEENGLAGYQNNNGLVAVFSDEIRLATSSAWWNGEYLYKKPITLKNLASQPIATATAQIVVNTKEFYDAGKLQNDCDDLEVVFIATQSGNLREKLNRSYILPSGVSDCANSTATIVSFPLRETVWQNGGIDSNYELYYGNPSASSPNTSKGFDLIRADGSTVSATLVCPFNGTTTCLNQQGTVNPTTATGAIRYSGGKGSALSFDGNDSLVLPSHVLPQSGPFTLEAWIYSYATHYRSLFIGNPYGTGVYVDFNPNGQISYARNSSNNSLSSFSPNQWIHFAFVYDGTNIYIFKNGVKNNPVASSGNLSTSSFTIYGPAGGLIDEVRISNIARYTSNFTPQTTPFEPDENTVLLLHFDENGDDPRNSGKAIDSSGRGNHGTIYGAKYVSGLVGVDSSVNDSGVLSIQPYAGHQGVFIEEGTTNLIINPSFENATAYNKFWTLPYFNYATASATFTPNMAKRNSAGSFAAGVMVQGKFTITEGGNDYISWWPNQITGNFYHTLDTSQGSIVFWLTPEWNGNDGKRHVIWGDQSNGSRFEKTQWNEWAFYLPNSSGQLTYLSASNITAGQTYNIVIRWDTKNKLNGTHHVSISINNNHFFYQNSSWSAPSAGGQYFGSLTGPAADSIIEGFTIYRRPLFDGQYGIDVGNGNEIAQIYNNGPGQDPTLVTGSWDVVFALPTNASTGQLTSGTGNAWSHPHSSNLLYTNTTNTGGFMMNGNYTADGWSNVGTPTSVSALATNEKIYAGGV